VQPIPGPHRARPPDFLDALLLRDFRAGQELIAVHLEKQRGRVPARSDKTPGGGDRGLGVDMERLRIELARECDDGLRRDVEATVLDDFADWKNPRRKAARLLR
jgi:hypothetical protein